MRKIILMVLSVLVLTSCSTESAEQQNIQYDNEVSVVFINVGKADSALLMINDKAYLIDTGSNKSVPALFRALAIMGVEKIDGLFLTHTHSDHIGGTDELAQKYQIDRLYSAVFSMNNKNGENKINNLASELELAHTKLNAGDTVEVERDIAFQVIAPLVYNEDDDNDNSLVLLIELNGKRFLFTGDMQFTQENTVLSKGIDISAHILKVGNHGNKDATSSRFAKAVSPEYAIISTDTEDDKDSAHSSVIGNLKPAATLLTQDYIYGIKMTVDIDGKVNISDLEPVRATANMEVVSIDNVQQTITIKNNGETTDISGYFIFSERGSEVFVFPAGSIIDAGQSITIVCSNSDITGDYVWDDKNVWHRSNTDTGILYDNFGNELSRLHIN
jgi:competence protein ComEC